MAEGKKKQLLYMKLRESILQDYAAKPYYSPLPGERELCDIYNVSRPTVRKALEILENEGCIARFPGKGAFFIGNSKEREDSGKMISTHIGFYNQVRLRGDYTSSKVLSQKIASADEEVSKALGIEKGTRVFYLERLRYINGELWSISDSYTPYSLCPELIHYDFTERSLHNTLSGYGHVPMQAKRSLTVRKADDYEAFNLHLEDGAPICQAKTVSYDLRGMPLEYAVSRSDIYKLSIEMTMQNKTQLDKHDIYTNML